MDGRTMSTIANQKEAQGHRKTDQLKSVSAKAAYSKAAGKKLAEYRKKLGGAIEKIRSAVAAGRIDANNQLREAQRGAEANLAAAEEHLVNLRKSSEETWVDLTDDVENAWEDLSKSIKMLVAKYSDSSTL